MGKSNQKTVKVVKEVCSKQNPYAMINLDALAYAAQNLSGDGFKMWVYFSKNQNHYELSLSSQHAESSFNLSKRRYDNAIHELIDKGFLCDVNSDPDEVANLWKFYEYPSLKQRDYEVITNLDKPLQQDVIRLDAQQYKASSYDDTRNNTYTTNNTGTKMRLNSEDRQEFIF